MLLGSDWNFGSNNKFLRYRLNAGLESELFGGAWKVGCDAQFLITYARDRSIVYFTAILVQKKVSNPG
jgi:hypothetical protein